MPQTTGSDPASLLRERSTYVTEMLLQDAGRVPEQQEVPSCQRRVDRVSGKEVKCSRCFERQPLKQADPFTVLSCSRDSQAADGHSMM